MQTRSKSAKCANLDISLCEYQRPDTCRSEVRKEPSLKKKSSITPLQSDTALGGVIVPFDMEEDSSVQRDADQLSNMALFQPPSLRKENVGTVLGEFFLFESERAQIKEAWHRMMKVLPFHLHLIPDSELDSGQRHVTRMSGKRGRPVEVEKHEEERSVGVASQRQDLQTPEKSKLDCKGVSCAQTNCALRDGQDQPSKAKQHVGKPRKTLQTTEESVGMLEHGGVTPNIVQSSETKQCVGRSRKRQQSAREPANGLQHNTPNGMQGKILPITPTSKPSEGRTRRTGQHQQRSQQTEEKGSRKRTAHHLDGEPLQSSPCGLSDKKRPRSDNKSGRDRMLSQQEKLRLQEKIDTLDDDQLEHVLEFLEPDLHDNSSDGGQDIELDFDKLSCSRQHELVKFVDAEIARMSTILERTCTVHQKEKVR